MTRSLLLFISLFLAGCNWCRYECDVFPGVNVSVEFVNSNGENLIQLGVLNADNIHYTIVGSGQQQNVFIKENKAFIDFIISAQAYTLVAGDDAIDLNVQIEEVDDGDCCNSYRLASISVDGVLTAAPNNAIKITL